MTDTAQVIDAERALAIAVTSQRRASDPAASSWVRANAGTGKTTVLTNRVLRLLLGGTRPQHILCLTFTKAAAAEMANRITAALARWATEDDDRLRDDIARLTGVVPSSELRVAARRLFAAVLDAPGGLRIQTIHAFCQSVLKRFPLEAGVAPHFTVADERDAAELLANAQNTTLLRARRGATPADRAVAGALADITTFTGEAGFLDVLGEFVARRGWLRTVVAQPGALARSIGHLYERLGVLPEDNEDGAVAQAASDSAFDGDALRRVAAAMLEGSARDREHGRIIADWLAAPDQRAANWTKYLSAFFTVNRTTRSRLIHKDALAIAPDGDRVLADEQARLAVVLERSRALTVALASAALLRVGAAVLETYGAEKYKRALLDYDDLIHFTRLLLTERSAAAWVLYKLDGGLDHILIDEAQDTSPDQWRLIQALAEEFFAGQGTERDEADAIDRTIFAVGDHKQSIFSVQGANPEWFEAMRTHFAGRAKSAERAWRPVDLEVSFRSTEAVLGAVDRVFGSGGARSGVVAADHAINHIVERAGQLGLIEVWPLVASEPSPATPPWSLPTVEIAPAAPRLRLARQIAGTIDQWITDGERLVWERTPGQAPKQRPVRPGDIMILVRRREGFVEEIVGELKSRGVPVAGVDRMRLTEQLAVEDLIAIGEVLLLPEDDLTLAAVLKGPLIGLDEDQLFTLAHDRGSDSLWRRLGAFAGRDEAFSRAHAALADLLARADFAPPYELFGEILDVKGGRRRLLARLGPDADDPIDEFLALALVYQRQHTPSLQGFLHWLRAGETVIKRDLEHGGDAVRVLTVHGAKGLQAPIVFLPDTVALPPVRKPALLWPEETGLPPYWAPLRADEDTVTAGLRAEVNRHRDEEYRRLLYVAMTRAADRLYVCGWQTARQPSQDCWYELITAALQDYASPIPFDFGDGWSGPGWRLESGLPGEPEDAALPDHVAGAAAIPDWVHRDPDVEPDPPKPLAPSRPLADEPPVRSPLDGDDGARFLRGRLVHRLLQSLPDVEPTDRAAAARRFLGQSGHGLTPAQIDDIAAETLAVLDHEDFAPLFGRGSLAEAPISGLVRGADGTVRVLTGQVDRLMVTDEAVMIIDYKTNRPAPNVVADVPEIYIRQMAAYRLVLKEIYPDRPVRCALIWTDGPRLMELLRKTLDSYAPS